MTIDQNDLLESVLDKTTAIIDRVGPDQRDLPTPCPNFDVATELGHMLGWVAFFATSAEGKEQDGDPNEVTAGADAGKQFRASADRAVAAFRDGAAERTLTLTVGEMPGGAVLGMMLGEYIGHGWDLAKATGQDVAYTEEEAGRALAAMQDMMRPEYRGPGSFDTEVEVPDDASTLDKLLGFTGRDPGWRPAA